MCVKCSRYMLLFALISLLLGNNFFVLSTHIHPSLQHNQKTLCHDHDKFALLLIKESFRIDCGVASSSTMAYPKVNSWHETHDCCRWDGVECDEKTGHVIGLDLSSSCLYGTFPPNSSLFELDHLLELNLAKNDFNYSQIPSAIGHLHKLTHLNLSESAFSGEVPSEISKLTSLSVLDLGLNGEPTNMKSMFNLKLHDMSLEMLVSNLTRLTQLVLNLVDISSSVPHILSNRSSLEVITLDSCNLFGEFPSNIFLLPNIEKLSLSFNTKLGGYFPKFHSDSPLRILNLYGTMFSSGLPSLAKLGSLRVLDLQYCELSGVIPNSIGNLTKLTTLSLSYSYFSGDLPISITNLTQLTVLGLSHAIITELETFNSWLPRLKLTSLTLNDMKLGNKILHSLQNLTRLNFLDLSQNQLINTLPTWLMNLTQLGSLDMSHNQLHGQIPSWISHLTSLKWLLLSFNNSVGMFDPFFKLPNLRLLGLSGITPTFPSNISTNTSLLKLDVLIIESCNLREFTEFLRQQDRLQGLLLIGSNIICNIPQWLVNLTTNTLLVLELSSNFLTGFEQPPVSLPWKKLEILNLSNTFQGPLLSPPSSLQIYEVSNNMFFGTIPKNICYGTSLIYLDLSDNKLSGQIPSCTAHKLAATLQVLNVRGNTFSGIIPHIFSTSCNLHMINLSQNQITGMLPRSIVNCLMLEVLDVGRNKITDTFPNWLGSLFNLQVLILRHNNFHGRIIAPSHTHNFQGLRIIDISNNFHTGNLPLRYIQSWVAMAVSDEGLFNSSHSFVRLELSLSNMITFYNEQYDYTITISNKGVETFYSKILTVFRVIDFSSNKFTGRIPDEIGSLRGIQALNLSNNKLFGGIPSSLSNITNLEALDLSQNMLTGKIPQDLAMLTFLEIFNVSHNQLVGPIPQAKQFTTFDASSFEGNLRLCGAQLSIKCGNLDPLPPSSTSLENFTNDEKIDWLIRLLGSASGFLIGFVFGKLYVSDRYHNWFVKTFGSRGMLTIRARRSFSLRL